MGGGCISSADDLEEGSVKRAEPHVLIALIRLFDGAFPSIDG